MSSTTISRPPTPDDGNTIEIWADAEDLIDFDDSPAILYKIAVESQKIESQMKRLFFILGGLIIAELEGIINENCFKEVVTQHLYQNMVNMNEFLIKKLAHQTYCVLKDIKKIPPSVIIHGTAEEEGLVSVSNENKFAKSDLVLTYPVSEDSFKRILMFSDFSLSNRVELAFYAVLLEMGFKQYNENIRYYVKNIHEETNKSFLPIYQRGIDVVISNTLYLTNRTYNIMYNRFYNNIIKFFVDKI